jgi:nucleoside 2-deoxyribosyltransferase
MKVYVAGKDISRAVSVMKKLRDAGHTITYDWATDFDNAEDLDKKRTQELASDELAGVKVADCLVYLWEKDQESARYEAGMAMGLGIPVLVVADHDSLFFHLSAVQQVESDDQITDTIEQDLFQ